MKKFANFIFDMDGTIWNTAKPAAVGFTRGVREHGLKNLTVTEQDIRENFGKTLVEIGATLMPGLPLAESTEVISKLCVPYQYEEMLRDIQSILYPGVVETLHRLAEHHGVYIVSNCLDGYMDMLFDHTDLGAAVADTAWYGHPGHSKAENIKYIIEKYALQDVAYVGDIEADRVASVAAGADFIYAAYGFGEVPQAEERIEKFSELLELAK